jgi:hypothetical protein
MSLPEATGQLAELRAEWESGRTLVVTIGQPHRILAILTRNGRYWCHRYFLRPFGDSWKWEVSVDRSNEKLAEAFLWLNEQAGAR